MPVTVVLAVYAFFGSDGTFEFRRVGARAEYDRERGRFGLGYYPSLSEGFVHGQLSMYEQIPPKLAALADPWNPAERGKADAWALWDASYLNGRYYMYWTPLPVFLLYIPFRLLAHGYPGEGFASAFFAAWTFIASVMFVRRALADRRTRVPIAFWILLLGLGNLMPYLMVFARTYEVANLCGAAMGATWACALLRFVQQPSPRRAMWMGVWLGMAIVARPNVGVLLVPAALAFLAIDKAMRRRAAIAAFIPLAILGTLLLAYNAARFGDPFEFGTKYQITVTSMLDRKVCSLCTPAEFARWANNVGQYLFAPVGVWSQFPFAILYRAQLDPATNFPAEPEPTAGIAPLIPLAMLGSVAALLLALLRDKPDASARAALLVMLGGWLVIAGLASCWAVDGRYTMDFAPLMTMSSIVILELALARLAPLLRRPALAAATLVVLGCYSILLGLALGVDGKNGAFRKVNPKTYHLLARPFGAPRE